MMFQQSTSRAYILCEIDLELLLKKKRYIDIYICRTSAFLSKYISRVALVTAFPTGKDHIYTDATCIHEFSYAYTYTQTLTHIHIRKV